MILAAVYRWRPLFVCFCCMVLFAGSWFPTRDRTCETCNASTEPELLDHQVLSQMETMFNSLSFKSPGYRDDNIHPNVAWHQNILADLTGKAPRPSQGIHLCRHWQVGEYLLLSLFFQTRLRARTFKGNTAMVCLSTEHK